MGFFFGLVGHDTLSFKKMHPDAKKFGNADSILDLGSYFLSFHPGLVGLSSDGSWLWFSSYNSEQECV